LPAGLERAPLFGPFVRRGPLRTQCSNFAFGGFTKFGCSTSVDTDRRLLTGDQLGERLKGAASQRRDDHANSNDNDVVLLRSPFISRC